MAFANFYRENDFGPRMIAPQKRGKWTDLFNFESCLFWQVLLVFSMLGNTSNTFSVKDELPPLLPQNVANFFHLFRWGLFVWGVCAYLAKYGLEVGKIGKFQGRFIFFFVAFFIYSVISVADMPRYGACVFLVLFLPLMLQKLLAKNGLDEVLKKLFYCAAFMTAVGMINYLRLGMPVRYTGWMGNPNNFVPVNIFLIAVTTACILRKNVNSRVGYAALGAMVFAQMAAGSRAGFATLLLLGGAFGLCLKLRSSNIILAGALVLGASYAFFQYASEDAMRILDAKHFTQSGGRENIYENVWPKINEHWWFGNGIDAEHSNYHSSYIGFLYKAGAPLGVFWSAWFIFSTLCVFFRRNNNVVFIWGAYMATYLVGMYSEDLVFAVHQPWCWQLPVAIGIIVYSNERRGREPIVDERAFDAGLGGRC